MTYSVEIKDEVIRRYNNGENPRQIAKNLNVSRPSIKNWLKEADIHIRTQSEAFDLRGRVWTNEKRLNYHRQYNKTNYSIAKIECLKYYGVNGNAECVKCHETNPIFLCIDHINNDAGSNASQGIYRFRAGSNFYAYLYKNKFPESFKLQTLCYNCNRIKENLLRSQLKHSIRYKESHDRNQNHKWMVINHYTSGKMLCQCCGYSDITALEVDHITEKPERMSGFYYWIIKNNYPIGFQILCSNCNNGKHINKGICPHKINI